MRATLTDAWPELTRPAYSSIVFGLLPAAAMTVGRGISVGTGFRDSHDAGGRRGCVESRAGAREGARDVVAVADVDEVERPRPAVAHDDGCGLLCDVDPGD